MSLHHNKITTINVFAFKGLTSLTELGLSHNQITTIDVNLFKNLSALQDVYLIENPLNCNNCKMQQIKIFLQNLTFPNLAAATMCDGGTLLFNYEFDNCTGPTEYSTDTTTSTSVISTTQ
ncbi:Hypothetical predicted protein, partial [Mytilus galloprovincialis]